MAEMRLPFALVLGLAGCDQLFGLDRLAYQAPDAPSVDAPLEGPCFGTGMLANLCLELPARPVELSTSINTLTDPRCRVIQQDVGPDLCVIQGETILVSEHVYVNGERPLVLLAESTVTIDHVLDASSRLNARAGAGAQTCPSSAGDNGTTGAGGGAGGTFGYEGGAGGTGQNNSSAPALGGAPNPVMELDGVMGGCAGGNGGVVSGTPASGGAGGGAVYVIAGSRIEVTEAGAINASGAGGAGGPLRGGGGGGGSGGFIALDAPELVIEGHVFARGGGGGGGGGDNIPGAVGADPATAITTTSGGSAGGGGALGTRGGDGCGAPAGQQGGFAAAAPLVGGGGGGGGCGRIHFYGTRTGNGPVNPEPT